MCDRLTDALPRSLFSIFRKLKQKWSLSLHLEVLIYIGATCGVTLHNFCVGVSRPQPLPTKEWFNGRLGQPIVQISMHLVTTQWAASPDPKIEKYRSAQPRESSTLHRLQISQTWHWQRKLHSTQVQTALNRKHIFCLKNYINRLIS